MGWDGYITLVAWVVHSASRQGTGSEVAHKWAEWLYHPRHLGGPQLFRAGDKIISGPQMGRGGCITPAAWGVQDASHRGTKAEVVHKWAGWLHNL